MVVGALAERQAVARGRLGRCVFLQLLLEQELQRSEDDRIKATRAATAARDQLGQLQGAAAEPDALKAQVAATPGDVDARYKLAALLARGRQYGEAIEQLLAIVGRNRAFRDDGARRILLALFAALGDQNPLVSAGRRKLANLLF